MSLGKEVLLDVEAIQAQAGLVGLNLLSTEGLPLLYHAGIAHLAGVCRRGVSKKENGRGEREAGKCESDTKQTGFVTSLMRSKSITCI